jgi:hypothetical protein
MVFGQNHQEDRLAYLLAHVPADNISEPVRQRYINLELPYVKKQTASTPRRTIRSLQ